MMPVDPVVIINYTLGLARSHYSSGPGQKLARRQLTSYHFFGGVGNLALF